MKRILIIENERDDFLTIKSFLEGKGFQCIPEEEHWTPLMGNIRNYIATVGINIESSENSYNNIINYLNDTNPDFAIIDLALITENTEEGIKIGKSLIKNWNDKLPVLYITQFYSDNFNSKYDIKPPDYIISKKLVGESQKLTNEHLENKLWYEIKYTILINNVLEKHLKMLEEDKSEFERLINTAETDEPPLQKFLTEKKYFFDLYIRKCDKVLPEFPIIGELISSNINTRRPDFILVESLKGITNFIFIEIESPNIQLFTEHNDFYHNKTHADKQIHDWTQSLEQTDTKENFLKRIKSELGTKEIEFYLSNCFFILIAGKTIELPEEQIQNIKSYASKIPRSEFLSYDDILERANKYINFLKNLK